MTTFTLLLVQIVKSLCFYGHRVLKKLERFPYFPQSTPVENRSKITEVYLFVLNNRMASTEIKEWEIKISKKEDDTFSYKCYQPIEGDDGLELESRLSYTKKDEAENAARQAIGRIDSSGIGGLNQ